LNKSELRTNLHITLRYSAVAAEMEREGAIIPTECTISVLLLPVQLTGTFIDSDALDEYYNFRTWTKLIFMRIELITIAWS
jgi:hypothetical protein